jgi:hypothetical protein
MEALACTMFLPEAGERDWAACFSDPTEEVKACCRDEGVEDKILGAAEAGLSESL